MELLIVVGIIVLLVIQAFRSYLLPQMLLLG